MTIGQTCEFQAWFNDSGAEGEHARGLFIRRRHEQLGLAPSTQKDGVDEYISGDTGQFVIGTFVADAAPQELSYTHEEVEGPSTASGCAIPPPGPSPARRP